MSPLPFGPKKCSKRPTSLNQCLSDKDAPCIQALGDVLKLSQTATTRTISLQPPNFKKHTYLLVAPRPPIKPSKSEGSSIVCLGGWGYRRLCSEGTAWLTIKGPSPIESQPWGNLLLGRPQHWLGSNEAKHCNDSIRHMTACNTTSLLGAKQRCHESEACF